MMSLIQRFIYGIKIRYFHETCSIIYHSNQNERSIMLQLELCFNQYMVAVKSHSISELQMHHDKFLIMLRV